MKHEMVAAELNIFNEKVKQKVLNMGGKDTFPSSIISTELKITHSVSTGLKMTRKRARIQQWTGYSI